MKYRYEENNSGGVRRLTDEDWRNLEKGGWDVDGCYAATKDFESMQDAIDDFEAVTGQDFDEEGCYCCGPPHYMRRLAEDDGYKCLVSGEPSPTFQLLSLDDAPVDAHWCWLSFCDPDLPEGTQFLGVALVQSSMGVLGAVQECNFRGINPGGEVQMQIIPDGYDVPEEYRNRLLTRDEAEALDEIWASLP